MLKPDDPVFDQLMKGIKKAVTGRYLEDPDAPISGMYKRAGRGECGDEFATLRWRAREDVICAFVSWDDYLEKGISKEQQITIIENVADRKPQERWFEGVFDSAILENRKIAGFKASVESMKNSPDNHVFEEMDGDRQSWADLSAPAKLQYIVLDAARHDVPFEPFAQVVKDTIGDAGEAALRVVLDGQKELHAIAKLFPDDGRIEPTPLVEQVKEMLDYVLSLETRETERHHGREILSEGIRNVLDGKPPRGEGVEAFRDTLREDRPMPEEVKSQEPGGRETERQAGVRGYWEAMPDKLEAIRQLWNEGRAPDFASFLRAAAERPEMAGVPVGHLRAAYDKMMEGEWEHFRSCMSEFPTSYLQDAAARIREHDAIMQDPFNLIFYKHPETVLAEQKALTAQEGVRLSERHEEVLRDALAMAGADRSASKAGDGKISLRDLRSGSQEQMGRGEGQRGMPREMER